MYPCYRSQPTSTCNPYFYLPINVEPIIDTDKVVEVPLYPSIGEFVHARHSKSAVLTLKYMTLQ